MNKIVAVVVTYNRLELLKNLLQSLREQTVKLDQIIVVNNSSTDGTYEWLNKQSDLYVITQENLGGAGGFHTGLKYAYEQDADWIWFMDDDIEPAKNCLELLIDGLSNDHTDDRTIRIPMRYTQDGKPFLNDVLKYNLTNPLSSFWVNFINEKSLENKFIKVMGATFEGPLIHKSLLQVAGFPLSKFFIYADDTEYFLRAARFGYEIIVFRDAKLYKKIVTEVALKKFSWKHYYVIRNLIAIDILHGNFFVRLLRPFRTLVAWLIRSRSIKEIGTTLKAFTDGYIFRKTYKQ